MLLFLLILALALLIFGVVGTIKIAAWLLIFILLGLLVLGVIGFMRRRV